MATENSPSGQMAGEERRRSKRYPLLIPVRAKWTSLGGASHVTDAQAKAANLQGGLLQFLHTGTAPAAGTELELVNLLSGEETKARVMGVRRSAKEAVVGIAVELMVPGDSFWGTTFRLKKTTEELFELEQAMKSGEIDSRVLREFRDAVDYVRKTAWAVQEWQERQAQKRDTATVLPLLITERIRRATELCNAVNADLNQHGISSETKGLDRLLQSVRQLYDELKNMFQHS